jgi:cell division protein FtsQ
MTVSRRGWVVNSAARVRTDPRISRRRKAVARAKRRKLTYQLSGAAAGALLVWATLWSPLLKVKTIDVEGAAHTSDAEVARVAGLDDKDNILFISASDVTQSVKALPWVESVQVDRILPGTVRVRIEEREPAMVLTSAMGSLTLDGTGRVLESGGESRALPTLATSETTGLAPGDTISDLAVRAAVRSLGSMPPDLRAKVKAVFAPTSERVSFTLEGGLSLRYGAAEELRDKHEVVLAILTRLKNEGTQAAYIDVRVPSNPAVAPLDPAETEVPTTTDEVGVTTTTETTTVTDESVEAVITDEAEVTSDVD